MRDLARLRNRFARGDVEHERAWLGHALRHTFASHLASKGRSLLEIMELLGHEDIESTLIYAHLMPERKHEAVAVLDEPPPISRQHSGNRLENFG